MFHLSGEATHLRWYLVIKTMLRRYVGRREKTRHFQNLVTVRTPSQRCSPSAAPGPALPPRSRHLRGAQLSLWFPLLDSKLPVGPTWRKDNTLNLTVPPGLEFMLAVAPFSHPQGVVLAV